MGKRKITRAAVFGAVCLPILPALAQEGGGVLYTFGISQDFNIGDNLQLDVPEQGSSAFADTNLSFGILSEREDQTLELDMGLSLTIENTPDTGSSTEAKLDNPFVNLSYDRQGANSSLGLNLNYDESSIDRLNLSDFVNSDGIFVLPEDFDSLSGTGNREAYDAGILLQLGTNAPLGFNLTAGMSGINYTDVTDPDLFDYDRTDLGAEVLFEISPVLTGVIGLNYDTYDASNAEQTYRTTTDGTIGIRYALSSRADLSIDIGVTQIQTEEFGLTTTDVNNPIWNLGYVLDMPNGELTADLDLSSDDDGAERRNFVVGRSMTLPDGSLSYSLGLTDPEHGDVAPIGSLDWQRALPSGQVNVNFNRRVASSNTDETQMTTSLGLGYSRNINAVSSLGLNLFYGLTDATSDSNGTTQTEVSATYSHNLTADWNLNTGVTYQVRDEDTVGRADSPSIFVSIGRDFTFRP